jgi:hypothetical protein
MAFDPELNGWWFNEAIMRLSDREALATLGRLCSVATESNTHRMRPPWWVDSIAPPLADYEPTGSDLGKQIYERRQAIERVIIGQLTEGKLVAWARRDSPISPYERVPPDAWPQLERSMRCWNWHDWPLRVEEITRHEPLPQQWPQSLTRLRSTQSLTHLFGLRPGHRSAPVREVVLRLYSLRIQPPAELSQVGKSASEARCREWLTGLMTACPDAPRPKADLEREAKQRFGLGQRAFERAWRGASDKTGRVWSRAGPRKSTQ